MEAEYKKFVNVMERYFCFNYQNTPEEVEGIKGAFLMRETNTKTKTFS